MVLLVHFIIKLVIPLHPDNDAMYDCSVQPAAYHLNFMIGILQNFQDSYATKYVLMFKSATSI